MVDGRSNRIVIVIGWVTVASMTIGMFISMGMWLTNNITDRAMIGLTLALSWLAMVAVGADFLLSAYTKRNVDEPTSSSKGSTA